MSQTNPDRLRKYRGTAGQKIKTADVSSDDHELRSIVDGEGGTQERIYDSRLAGERFVNFYDDSAAAIREALSNAETACIRRARNELLDSGFSEDEIPSEVSELLDMAKEETGYEPLIEVTYNRKSDATRFIIEDNGIGISVEEYEVVQRVGYSASHDDGSVGGQFGLGWLSLFQLTGVNGMFKMSTKSRLTDEAYSTAEYVANFEMLDHEPDEYGTRFEFPGFGEAAKEIDIPAKVEEYADGMVIPVLYRDFDESGQETSRSDDYLATRIEDDYADDSLVITFENEYFKAVMSPDPKENGRGLTTYNISMPIRRNCDEWGTDPKFEAPWSWDFRAKQENGPIVHCESDPSLEGLVPKENTKYDRLLPEMQEKCVPMSQVPDDAIVMPQPASSRDSFMSGHDDFWRHVSECLNDAWAKVAAERFEQLDSWDDFLDMSRAEKQGLFRAYSQFGSNYDEPEPDTIQETLEANLGVTVDKELGAKIHRSQGKVSVVRRGHDRAHTKGACWSKKIWQVIDEAPDGVYMGKSISQKKAEIVWGLGETHVVRLTSTDESYDEYEDDWNWTKAKELPNRNLKEKLPELDDDIAEKFENVSDSNSNNTQSTNTGGNGQDPSTYRGKVRVGSNSRKYFSYWKLDDLIKKLSNDEAFKAGRYSCDYLIIHEDDVSARTVARSANKQKDIAAMRLPKYAYQYMVNQPNVYESMGELRDDLAGVEVKLSDDTEMDIRDLPETDCILVVTDKIEREYSDDPETLVDVLGFDADEFDRFTFLDPSDFDDSWGAETDATVILTKRSASFNGFEDYEYVRMDYTDVLMADKLGDIDKSSDEYQAMFGSRYGTPSSSKTETLIEIAERARLGDNQ